MHIKRSHSRNRRKLVLFSLFLGISLIFGCFIGINAVNPAPALSSTLVEEDAVPLACLQWEGNLTREWEPIVLTIADVPQLTNLRWENIRVVYYDTDNASWISVPFQIDEVDFYTGWEEGQFITGGLVPGSAQIPSVRWLDIDGMDNAFGGFDELVFYAHPGARVASSMWWEGDAAGVYPNRIELSIIDPVDGGRAWVYIYYDFLDHGDPMVMGPAVAKWIDYPEIGWNDSVFLAYGENYNVSKSKSNPDLEIDIRKRDGGVNFINETPKVYSNITFTDLIGLNKFTMTGAEGTWNSSMYSGTKTEIQSTDSGFYNTEGGTGTVPVSGPIRTIVNRRMWTDFQINATHTVSILDHQADIYYMDSKVTNYTKQVPNLGPTWNITVDFNYDLVTSLDTSVRSNYLVYDGWVQEGLVRRSIPNGLPNETNGELRATNGPTSSNPKQPVGLNGHPLLVGAPDIPDFFLFTSTTQGSMWMYSPRQEIGNVPRGVYWRDDDVTSEIGYVLADVVSSGGSLEYVQKWKYLGPITTQQQARDEGINTYLEFNNTLQWSTFDQFAPQDNYAPEIMETIQLPFPAVNNESTVIVAIVNDTDVGVHKVQLFYDNGSGVYITPMDYYSEYGVYIGLIPVHPYLTDIIYWIEANDTYGNRATTAFDFLGTYSFTYDPVGADPIFPWFVTEPPNTAVDVMSELDYHRKVVVLWDNNSLLGMGAQMETAIMPNQTGTLEMWVYGMDGPNNQFFIELYDSAGGGAPAIQIVADWSIGVKQLSNNAGLGWSPIVASPNFTSGTWHHLRLAYDCTLNTYNIWVDGAFYGVQNFAVPAFIIDSIILSTTGYMAGDSDQGATVFVDALDASFDWKYYPNRNMDTYQELPDYKAEYSFEPEGPEGRLADWIIWEDPMTFVDVTEEKSQHRNVVEFWDQSNPETCSITQNFTAQTNGTIEWWMNGNDFQPVDPAGEFFVRFQDRSGIDAIVLRADWSTVAGGDRLQGSHGLGMVDIVPPGMFQKNTWYHIRVDFDVLGTYQIFVDGMAYGSFNFLQPVIDISQIQFGTGPIAGSGGNLFSAYIDAVDYSWADGYYLNRNYGSYIHGRLYIGFNFTVTDPYPPPKVRGVTPTNLGIGNTLNVSWTVSPAEDVEGYRLWTSTQENGPYTLHDVMMGRFNTSTIVSSLTDGQTYWFMVQAFDGVPGQFGENSTKKAGIPTDVTPPAQVTGVLIDVIPTGNELNITWNANTEPDFDYYKVYRGNSPDTTVWIADTNDTFYFDSGLTDLQIYWYRITAVDDGINPDIAPPFKNEGVPSAAVDGTPNDTTEPAPVTSLQVFVVPEGDQLDLQWDDVNFTGDVDGYRIYRNITESTFQLITTISDTWYNDTAVDNGKTYVYKVAAIDEVPNEGLNSTAVNGTPWDSVPPDPVTITPDPVAAIPAGKALNISWTANTSSDVAGYWIYNSTSEFG
ncbi:MAG: hypothetical protein HWN66_10475, partial [Candidatus Helarchaeota archaeon]|nr:hypothetical protein [Candidatus Helarchaeota archaeon]